MSVKTVHLGFEPYEHQRHANTLMQACRFLVLVWHRRGGKTVYTVLKLVLSALTCRRPRGRYGYVAPLLKQAKSVAWDYLRHFTKDIPGIKVNESELSVRLPNGAQVRLFGADNPDSLRGLYFDGIALDEVADMKPSLWGEIIRPALTDRQGWAIFIGTPKGVNLFSELYHQALKGEDGWRADLRRASDTGVIPAHEVEHARRTMSPAQFAQEFDCDFGAASANALIPFELALEAMNRTVAHKDYEHAAKVLGVDVARYGDDRSALALRQGLMSAEVLTFRKLDGIELAGKVARVVEKEKPDAIFIDDTGGFGGSPLDHLRHLGFRAQGVKFSAAPGDARFQNKRVEMWGLLAEWVKGGGCLFRDEEMLSELTAPTYSYDNARGVMTLESKDDMRSRGLASPDKADALALTFAMPVASQSVRMLAQANRKAKTAYDPFAGRGR